MLPAELRSSGKSRGGGEVKKCLASSRSAADGHGPTGHRQAWESFEHSG